jgi:CDP-ribitol ribitolphosphotransferase
MWHALGAIKKFGYQSVGAPGGRSSDLASAMSMHRNYDVVLCGGPAAVPIFAEAFAVDPAIVKPTGLPRIDYLRAHADARARLQESPAADFVRRFPLLADRSRRVVLYAPTFRRGGENRFGEVLERFGDERYALVVKPHLLEHVRTEGANVVDATGVSVLDLLPLCDVVITDYSAVAFEACVLDKPVYFYVYDIDRYRHDCGLNIDPLAEFGAIASRDIADIGRLIDAETYDDTPLRRLKNGYVPAADGSCTARIAEMVLDLVTAP